MGERASRWLWSATLGRGPYAALSVGLIALRYGLHRLAGALQPAPSPPGARMPWAIVGDLPPGHGELVLAAIAIAVAGLALTACRLRDAALPLGLVALLFLPLVNVLLLAALSLAPRGDRPPMAASQRGPRRPQTRAGSAAAGVALTGLLAWLALLGGVPVGVGLVFELPFCLGLLSGLVHAGAGTDAMSTSLDIGLLSVAFAWLAVLAVTPWVALVTFWMAPLWAALAVAGAITARAVRHAGADWRPRDGPVQNPSR